MVRLGDDPEPALPTELASLAVTNMLAADAGELERVWRRWIDWRWISDRMFYTERKIQSMAAEFNNCIQFGVGKPTASDLAP